MTTDVVAARPFLKWAGGKTSLLSEILPRLPDRIGTYYEPFLGGGAVFFALASDGRFKRAVLGDLSQDLMRAYSVLASRPDDVIRALKKHIHDEKYYYKVRAQDPRTLDAVAQAARFIYLNKTCFNGLYRTNKKGQFNTPWGKYKNPTICDEENLRAVALVLENAAFVALDFQDVVMPAKEGDVVYFDPPYVPVSETSNFTGYVGGGFSDNDQERLRNVAVGLVDRGVHVLLSNADMPRARELYGKKFKLESVRARRAINSNGGKRGEVGELLIGGRNA